MTSEERRAFLSENRLCIVGYGRKDGPPALSPVYYVLDGDDLLISTTATRAKAKAVRRNPQVSLCVIGDVPWGMPHPYLTIYGRARIETDGAVDLMMRVGEKMLGRPIPEDARPSLEDRAREEHRVVMRVTPEAYVP